MKAFVRELPESLAGCELTHVEAAPVDRARACEQHAGYVSALEELGVEVVRLPALEGPDSVFVEDALVAIDGAFVLTRPGAESRRGEVEALAPHLTDREVLRLAAPATLDGGDVLRVDDVLYVGMSSRTNHAGLKALAHLVLEHGYRVKAAHASGCLHLKTGCSWLGGERLLVNPEWISRERLEEYEWITVDPAEPFAANVLAFGDRVLCPASAPRTAERLAGHGLEPRLVDISEFEKMEAGLTCLSVLH